MEAIDLSELMAGQLADVLEFLPDLAGKIQEGGPAGIALTSSGEPSFWVTHDPKWFIPAENPNRARIGPPS